MKVIHTIRNFGVKSGGISTCTYDLLSAMHKIDDKSTIDLLTIDIIDPEDMLMGVGEDWIKIVPYDYKTPFAISKNLQSYLNKTVYDIYHTNGMWLHINHFTCAKAKAEGKPYIISTHGMLYPEAMRISYWKKWPMWNLWFKKDMINASVIHVTCETEMKHVRNLGYKGPIALIGNPVCIPDYTAELMEVRKKKSQPFFSVAFLGRLHPIKKVENLVRGVYLSSRKDIIVYIIGKGEDKYERFLKDETIRLGIEQQVKFLGFLNGFDKYAQLGIVDCLFIPSEMENFGMIVPESLLVGTPVLASLGTPWKSLNSEKCGWWTDNSPESIANVISNLYALSQNERISMGQRGRDYILRTFAANNVASKMLTLYRWILGEAPKPDFIYIDK